MLYLLPPLLNAAILALLSTSIPLAATIASTFVAILPNGSLILDPNIKTLPNALSVHAIAFSSQKQLMLVESEGLFDMDTWDTVTQLAESACCRRSGDDGGDGDMDQGEKTVEGFIKDTVESRLHSIEAWRQRIK